MALLWPILSIANSNVLVYTLTEQDGLTDNTINCFYQDSRGIMWMGTSYGLNSYDGSVIRKYTAGPTNALPDNVINDIKEDDKHRLWIGTGNGLCCYDGDAQQFSTYRYSKGDAALNRYYSLVIIADKILLATEKGLLSFNVNTKQFDLYSNPQQGSNNWITKVYKDRKGNVWLASYNGLWQFDINKRSFTSYDSPQNDPLFEGLVTDVFEDHSGAIWIGTWNKGLKRVVPATKQVENYLSWPGSHTNVVTISEQRNEYGQYELWLSNKPGKLDIQHHRFTGIETGSDEKVSIATANRMYCDKDNLLWISTPQGVKIYNPHKQNFNTVILSKDVPITTQGVLLLGVHHGFLLGAQGNSGLLLFNDSAKVVKNYSYLLQKDAAMLSIQQDEQMNYWFCTTMGIAVADSAFKKIAGYRHEVNKSNSLPRDFVNYILFKKNGRKWFFPWQRGVWEIKDNRFIPVYTATGDTLLARANISKAVEDAQGNIWFTDYVDGAYKYKQGESKVRRLVTGKRMSNIYLLNDHVWFTGPDTLFSVDINNDGISRYALPEGYNKYVNDFVPDNIGNIWMATRSGLLAFNIKSGTFRHFTEGDGLYSNDVDASMALLPNGTIVMSGNKYLTYFTPAAALSNNMPAPVLFTGIKAGDKIKQVKDATCDVSWNEQNISFEWGLLNFSNPKGNQYYYKLDGIDKNWQYAGNRGYAAYRSLKPDNYVFHYRAATPEGVMSSEGSVILIIHPPFWQTWWFRVVCLLVTGWLFFYIVRYISQRNLKERVLRLEKEQAVEKERNRISRDMHDDLGSGLTKIAILSEVLKTKTRDDNATLDKISETARVLVDNLDEMVWALNPKNDSLDKLAAYIAEYAHKYMEGTGMDCVVSLPEEIPAVSISEERRRNIFMAVKEFLNNTVKHSKATRVTIELKVLQGSFIVLLADDGRGFDMALTNGMGNGLQNMQQRITDIGGRAVLSSSAEGTMLSISCPV